MFEQQRSPRPPGSPPTDWPEEAVILDWIAAGEPIRADVLGLMATYHDADAGHDISSFLPLIDEVDAAMRLLNHRVEWLRRYLGHCAEESIDRP